jgi:hypothetical protein
LSWFFDNFSFRFLGNVLRKEYLRDPFDLVPAAARLCGEDFRMLGRQLVARGPARTIHQES